MTLARTAYGALIADTALNSYEKNYIVGIVKFCEAPGSRFQWRDELMRTAILPLAALSMLATFVSPANAGCYQHCNPTSYVGWTRHTNCY